MGLADGVAVGLRVRKSKALYHLEGQTFNYHLVSGSARWQVLSADNRNSDEVSGCGECSLPTLEEIAPASPIMQEGLDWSDSREALETEELSDQEQRVLNFLLGKGQPGTRQEIQDEFNWEMSKTNKILGSLQKKHLLDKIGGGCNVSYMPRKKTSL